MPRPNNSDTKLTLSEKEELKLLRQGNEYLEAEYCLESKSKTKWKSPITYKETSMIQTINDTI